MDIPLCDLVEIVKVKVEYDWTHTAALLAMVYNRTIWGKGKRKSPDDFMPTGKKKSGRTRLTPSNLEEAFGDG